MTRWRGLLDRHSACRTLARRNRRASEDVSTSPGSQEGGPEAEDDTRDRAKDDRPASTPSLSSLSKQQFNIMDLGLRTHFPNILQDGAF